MPQLLPPKILLFDWQNTLASTMDALYNAVDDTLMELKPQCGIARSELGLYVLENHKLPASIREDKKLSRTDLFHLLFDDEMEREKTHDTFNDFYRQHYKDVHALDTGIEPMLRGFRSRGIKLGIVSNRKREFLEHELAAMGWDELFHAVVAAGDGCPKKPSPEPLLLALSGLRASPGREVWFVGDGKSDMQCGSAAKVGTVFYNFARWGEKQLSDIFTGTKPDAVVQDYDEFGKLVERLLSS